MLVQKYDKKYKKSKKKKSEMSCSYFAFTWNNFDFPFFEDFRVNLSTFFEDFRVNISTFLFLRIFQSTYRVFTLISIGNTKIIKQENRKSLYSIRLQWSHYIVHIRYSIETMYSLQFIVNYIEIRIAESLIFSVLLCEPLSVFFWP
jgi:hypothetical protein